MVRRLLLIALLWPAVAAAQVPVPPLSGRIVDLTQTLSMAETRRLEATLQAFEQRKGAQIVVLMLPTTAPEPIEAYGIRVAEAWKIGRAGVDDGIIVIVARDDRAMRIEVGYGLEGVVPDASARRLIEEYFLPAFRGGDYFAGLSAGIDRLIAVIDGEPLPAPAQTRRASDSGALETYFALFLFLVFAGGRLLRALLGRVGGAAAVAAVAGFAGWLIAGALLIAVLLAIAGFALTLFGGGASGIGRIGGVGGGYRGGGYRGGGFGGGGFSGGGGGFGGGGASGRW